MFSNSRVGSFAKSDVLKLVFFDIYERSLIAASLRFPGKRIPHFLKKQAIVDGIMDFGDDPSIHRLMEFLKIAFQPRHLDDVEEKLIAREKKLKDEADLLKEENRRLRSDKLGVEAKLKELLARVNGETTVIQERERKLMEEVHQGKAEVTELRTKIIELEKNNSIAEAAAAQWKKRFEDLEPRISQLEKDAEVLRQGFGSPISKNIRGGLDANCTLPESSNGNSVHVKTEADVFDRNENPCQNGAPTRHFITTGKDNSHDTGDKGHGRRIFVEISDSDDDECEKQESCEKSPQNYHSNEDGVKSVSFMLKRKQDPPGEECCMEENAPSSKHACLQEMRRCGNQASVERAPQSHRSEIVFDGDSEDSDSYSDTDSVKSCGKWKDQMEMWLALHKDPELCMDAVCALYRQKNLPEGLVSSKHQGIILEADAVRITELAEFLIDGDGEGNGKRRKSIEELMEHDKNGIQDCQKIASSIMYSEQLFHILNNPHSP